MYLKLFIYYVLTASELLGSRTWPMLTVERFVSTQKELLSLEQDEETAQNKSLFHGQSGILY